VKFFKPDRGFGFIRPDDGGNDVFVHANQVKRAGLPPVHEGMRVGFDFEPNKRSGKNEATNLRLL
jgi:CspA family cold shock protein